MERDIEMILARETGREDQAIAESRAASCNHKPYVQVQPKLHGMSYLEKVHISPIRNR